MADEGVKVKINGDSSGFRKAVSGLGGIAKSAVAGVTAAVAGVSAGLAAGAAAAYKFGTEYETSLAKVSTIADTSKVSIDSLSKSVMDLSSKTGIAAADLNEATYQAISAGVDSAKAVDFVGQAAKLAKGGFTDATSAVDVMTTVLNAYGMSADKAGRVSDVLMQIQNKGKTTVGELASSMGKVIPTANAYGVSLENLGAAYSITTAKGIATAESTTYINSMLNELGKSGTKASETLKSATGKSFKELMDSGANLGDVLGILQNEADKAGLSMGDMFGSAEAGKAATTLLAGGVDGFSKSLDNMNNSAGLTEEAYKKMDSTVSSSVEKMKNNFKNLGISIYNDSESGIAKTAGLFQQFSADLVDGYTKDGLQGVFDAVDQFIPKLLSLIVSSAPKLIETAVSLIKSFVEGLKSNKDLLIDSALEIITTLISGIIDLLPDIIEMGLEVIISLAEGIAKQLPKLIPAAVSMILEIVQGLIDNLPKLIDCALDLIMALVQGLLNSLPQLIKAAPKMIQSLVDGLINSLDKIIDCAVDLIVALIEGIIENLPEIAKAAPKIISSLIGGLVKALGKLSEFGLKLFNKLKDVFTKTDWGTLGKNILNGIVDGIKNAVRNIGSAISSVGESIKNKFCNFFGIHSPSRLMRDLVGNNIGLGLANGIVGSTKDILSAIDKQTDEIGGAYDDLSFDIAPELSFSQKAKAALESVRGFVGSAVMDMTPQLSLAGGNGIIQNTYNYNTTNTREAVIDNVINLDGERIYQNQKKVASRHGERLSSGEGW